MGRTRFAALIALIVVAALLASCGAGEPLDVQGGTAETSAAEAAAVPMTAIDDPNVIIADGEAYYTLVYPEGLAPEALAWKNSFVSGVRKSFGVSVPVSFDIALPADDARQEIRIGQTNRADAVPAGVTDSDAWYLIRREGNSVAVNGSSGYMLALAVNAFAEKLVTDTERKTVVMADVVNEEVILKDYCAPKWELDCVPPYTGSTLWSVAYDCGTSVAAYRAEVTPEKDAYMVTVTGTNAKEYAAYLEKLKGVGYTVTAERNAEGDLYTTLENAVRRVHAYFINYQSRVRIIAEPTSISSSVSAFSYTAPKTDRGAEIYLYGLNMDSGGYNPNGKDDSYLNTTGFINCGACLIIRLSDNSIIFIDGGNKQQMVGLKNDSAPMKQLNDFLHEITGKGAKEKITIACWYLTHNHSDHLAGFYEFLNTYSGLYDLERVCVNPPSPALAMESEGERNTLTKLSMLIATRYPGCLCLKPHTGMKFTLADAEFDIVFTHEDQASVTANKLTVSGANDCCTVARVVAGGMSMMILGDMNTATQDVILEMRSNKTLQSDIVQVAHHGFNNVASMYREINAPIALFPQAEGGMHKNDSQQKIYNNIVKYSKTCYFSGSFDKTVGLALRDGKIVKVYPEE